MPKWNEYKAEAKARGALAFELYAVQSTPAGDMSSVKDNLAAHLAYQADQEKKGNLFLAGPLSDESGEEMIGAGLIIYKATTLEQARELADADPMHQSGARNYTLRRWLINEGNLSLSIGLSRQEVAIG